MNKLTLIQNELKAPKNQYNSFGKYKYRSCEDILEAVKPLLEKYECKIMISDEIKEAGSLVYVESKVTFSDGKSNESVTAQAGIDPNRKGMDIAQSFGSSSSYARKYALSGLLLIDDSKEIDTAPPKKPTFDKTHKGWSKAVEALAKGNTTINAIETKYKLSDETKEALTDAASNLV
jgi:hypothetical protein